MDMTDSECYPHHHIKLRKWEFHTVHKLDSHNFFKSSSEDIFFSLLLGGEEGRERNIDVREKYWLVPSRTGSDQRLYTPRLGNQTHNLGMSLTRNQMCNLSVTRQCSNQLSHTDQSWTIMIVYTSSIQQYTSFNFSMYTSFNLYLFQYEI